MICNGLLTTHLVDALGYNNDFEKNITEILELMQYSKKHKTYYFKHEDSMYNSLINEMDFGSWLYDRSDPSLKEIKQELWIEINKSETIIQDIELDEYIRQESTFIVGGCDEYKMKDLFDYLNYKQNRLKRISSKSKFGDELQECYYNIFFDINVPATLSTLNNKFLNIRDEIIEHLHKLDQFCKKHPERLDSGHNSDWFTREFKAFSGIECTPQSERDATANLKRDYINTLTQYKESLNCEMHTKFRTFNKDATKQDRIYFHKGKKGIMNGKLIVIHIGTHA